MPEKETADHLAAACDDRDGEIAAHRQVPLGLAVVWGPLAVARVLEDVVGANDRRTVKGRTEQRRRTRMAELRERLTRRTRERVEREHIALRITHGVEEGTELRARELRRRVRHRLHERL